MATYFPISNNERDSTTMLHLTDATYSETPVLPSNMMMYMNFSSSSSSYSDALGSSDSNTTQQQQILLNFGGSSRDVEHQLNAWGHTPNLKAQGLSLSLGTQVVPSVMQMSNIQYQNDNPNFSSNFGVNTSISGEDNTCQTKQMRDDAYMVSRSNLDAMKGDISSYGVASVGRTVPNSKFLKAAQELLDEVVSVKKAMKGQNSKKELTKDSKEVDGESRDRATDPSSVTPKESKSSANELSAAEKQELQNKMTKLLSMLDEVDRRYRQYYHQMEIVVSSFDVVAGSGAAKPYTALALQTISRHFRCLRDAINGQIHSARKSLGEEDDSANDKGVRISRLRYVDQQLRQQRALQQLGMMQNHAWRPQRGLPETSVSILRAWLFEHFLHPYPKDSDKTLLARQTGLTRSQVSNWFINARVRLWKPMVEEMYKEEAGDADMDSNSSSETTPQATKTSKRNSEDRTADMQQSVTACGQLFDSKSNHDAEMIGPDTKSIFQNNLQANYWMGKMREGQNSSFTDAVPQSNRFIAGHAEYQMSEMERFGNNAGGVSLTLGLQQCEGGTLAMSDGTVHAFVPTRDADIYNATAGSAMGTGSEEYDCMDLENRPHRLFSSLLRSFT